LQFSDVFPPFLFDFFLAITVWSIGLIVVFSLWRALGFTAFWRQSMEVLWDELRRNNPTSWLFQGWNDAPSSASLRQQPDRRQRMRLRESMQVARQPDGSAIVYPYFLLFRGYHLAPAQFDRFHAWRLTALDAQRREKPVVKWLCWLIVIIAIATCLTHFAKQFAISGLLAAILISCLAAIAYARHRQKRVFETAFPDAIQRVRDSSRRRKRMLLIMLMPFFSHLSVSVLTPFLAWFTVFEMSHLWRLIHDPASTLPHVLGIASLVVVLAAFTSFIAYIACRHIAFRIRHGRGPSVDDFYAL
jgi:hypothetical protein